MVTQRYPRYRLLAATSTSSARSTAPVRAIASMAQKAISRCRIRPRSQVVRSGEVTRTPPSSTTSSARNDRSPLAASALRSR